MYQTGYVLLILAVVFCSVALLQYNRHPFVSFLVPREEETNSRFHDPYRAIDGVKTLHGYMRDQEHDRQLQLRKQNFSEEIISLCTKTPEFFEPTDNRSIVAISSFPGSGNTWARHLLHMASGYWTGNRRGSNHLKQYGWAGEDVSCRDRTTVAQKTHRLHHNKACHFEKGIIVVRNPFDAILAAYNHHKAGKTGEPDYSVFKKGDDWPNFVKKWAGRWKYFHEEWINFNGSVYITCFETMRQTLKGEIAKWLTFLDLDHSRLDCVDYDSVGQFYRHKTKDYSHIYTPSQRKKIMSLIQKTSKLFQEKGLEDCTKNFDYSACCNNGTLPF